MSARFPGRRHFVGTVVAMLAAFAVLAPGAAAKPSAAPLSVTALASAPADAKPGNRYALRTTVTNPGTEATSGPVVVRLLRFGYEPRVVGRMDVRVPAQASRSFQAAIEVPMGLDRGSYMLAACTPQPDEPGALGCATARRSFDVGSASPVRGPKALAAMDLEEDQTCSSGARTLSKPGDHIYPEVGNGGYKSIHTDVNLVYDAVKNEFLEGNHVVLQDLATQCLTDFSLDFERTSAANPVIGPNMQVNKVFVNGEEAAFEFVQPTYPGNPNGFDDPDPLAHQTGQDQPVSANNPLPPACSPEGDDPEDNGLPCPANKLVITPTAPLPSGEMFEVKVEYTGRPGVHTDGDGSTEGWFRSNNPVGDGSFVTTEPVGSMAWMPLNNHPTAKPTYDFHHKVTKGRTAIGNGVLVRSEENPPDAQFPDGSTTWVWHSPEPIANYLVQGSIGNYDLTERLGADGILYYQVQGSSIIASRKATNKALMDQLEEISNFHERFSGPYPFTSNGVVVGIPAASFQEEMQTKIAFNNQRVSSLSTLHHENFHQWWGDNVAESHFNETFYKEGLAQLSAYLLNGRIAAIAAGGLDTPAGEAAFDAVLVAQFKTNYGRLSWVLAPSNPTPASLFASNTTYERTATAYIALRQILGKENFANALKQIQSDFRGGSIEQAQLETALSRAMPNQSPACRARLNTFFTEWFDTEFPAKGAATAVKPQLTGPGLDVSASGTTFYNADGTCKRVAAAPPVTSASLVPEPREGKIAGPATVVLTAADNGDGVASTEFKIDGAAFQTYKGPFTVTSLGAHTVEFRSTSREGGVEATKQIAFTVIQNDAPVTSASILFGPVNGRGPATVVLEATDNGGGVQSTEFNLDGTGFQPYEGPFTVSAFGEHTVEFRSTDRDGIVEATRQVTFAVVPHDPPVTSATVSQEPFGPATVTLAATENGGGVASTEFSLDGDDFQPYNGPFTVSAFGEHTVEFRSTNRDGVVEVAKQVAFTVVPHDAPVTSATITRERADGRGPATVTLSAAENGGGVASTEFSLDGDEFQPYEGPFIVSDLGDHMIEFRSTNRDGVVEETRQVAFTVVPHDAPVTSATISPDPVDGNVIGPATVTLTATENGGGVASTEFSLDGDDFQPYEGPFIVSGFGEHTVEFRSTNRDGVVEETGQLAFTVNPHSAPVTTASILPNPDGGKITGQATLVLEATDPSGGGIASTEFSLDGGAFQPYEGPVAISILGNHTVTYRSTNRDGVAELAKQVAFAIVAPTLPPPVCAEPRLTMTVSRPLRRSKGVATLRRGKAYRHTGRLTCGPAGTPAPEGTVVSVSSLIGGQTSQQPGVAVGGNGRIDTLLRFPSKRTVIFRFAADGASAEARIRIAVAKR